MIPCTESINTPLDDLLGLPDDQAAVALNTVIPFGYCHCGCGQKTELAPYSAAERSWVRGQPKKYVYPHQSSKWRSRSCGSGKPTRTYVSWQSMMQRTRPNWQGAHLYSERGITVWSRWQSYDNFLADMGERPEGTTLDRINVDGIYESGNCRWADAFVQANNTRKNRRITSDGMTLTCAEWGRKNGLKTPTICQRLKTGWTPQYAVTLPLGSKKQ